VKTLFIVMGMMGLVFQYGGVGIAQVPPPPPAQGIPGVAAPLPGAPETPPRSEARTPLPPGSENPGRIVGQPVPPPPPPAEEGEPSAARAVAAARRVERFLKPGSVWTYQGPAGDKGMKAALMYQGRCIAVIDFDPVTGRPLPTGEPPSRLGGRMIPSQEVEQELPAIVRELKVLEGAEFRAPEAVWVVPLSYRGAIVTYVKISRDGRQIIPDVPAEREMHADGP